MNGLRYPIALRWMVRAEQHSFEPGVNRVGRRLFLRSLVLLPALVLVASMNTGCDLGGAPATAPLSSTALFIDAAFKPEGNQPADKTVLRSRFAAVNLGLFSTAGGPSAAKTLTLNLFPDVLHTAVLDRVETTSTGFIWVGHVQGVPNSQVALSVQDNVVAGSIFIPNAHYRVRFAGNGLHAIEQINQAAFPPD